MSHTRYCRDRGETLSRSESVKEGGVKKKKKEVKSGSGAAEIIPDARGEAAAKRKPTADKWCVIEIKGRGVGGGCLSVSLYTQDCDRRWRVGRSDPGS